MNILAFTNNTGSKHWRLSSIANYVNTRTKHEWAVIDSNAWTGDIIEADVVVAQMWRNPEGVALAKKQGAKVVYEADDIILGVGGKKRKELMDLTDAQSKQTIDTIKACDAVTVTTEPLAEHYRQFHKNVHILPNYMDFLWWGKPLNVKRRPDELRIGWAGSKSHREDLFLLIPVMKKILKDYPGVKFIYCGYGGMSSDKLGTEVGWGQDIFQPLPRHRREYYLGVPLEYWPIKSKTLALDIALAPLLDDEFNAGKSNIKWQEYSANLVPGVYSDTVVYNDTVKHGKNGFLAKTTEDWVKSIETLINSREKRKDIATTAFKDTFDNWNLEDHYGEWIDLYESL